MNLTMYLGALGAFEFFLTQLIRYRNHIEAQHPSALGTLPVWALRLSGYVVFAHSSLEFGALQLLTPDLCVSAIVYLAAGLLLKIASKPGGPLEFPTLGGVLGLGYLAKAPMFPIGLIFFGAAAVVIGRRGVRWRALASLTAGLSLFALLVSILVCGFFRTYGYLTLGESGRMNYAIFVDGLPLIHWRGDASGSGTPLHPTRQILASPPLYEFATPTGGTYPPWFDPAYWYEGVKPHLDPASQAQTLMDNGRALLDGVLAYQTVIAAMVFVLWCRTRSRLFTQNLSAYHVILVPAILSIGIFVPIHLEPRFVVAFVVLVWTSLFAALPWPAPNGNQRALAWTLGAMLALLVLSTLLHPGPSYWQLRALGREILGGGNPHTHWTVARGLQQMSVQRGDPVAVIGLSLNAYWAHLLGSRIVAEMPACIGDRYHGNTCTPGQPDGVATFLAADQATRHRILDAFARTGAKVVVISIDTPLHLAGWQRIGSTNYYAYLFAR